MEAAPTVVPVGSVPTTGVTTHSSGQAAFSTSSMSAQGADTASDMAEDHHSSALPDDQVAFHPDDVSSITSRLLVTAVSACSLAVSACSLAVQPTVHNLLLQVSAVLAKHSLLVASNDMHLLTVGSACTCRLQSTARLK